MADSRILRFRPTHKKKIIYGRRLRVDTTVVETDIHYPTDSTLLGDAVRVLTRAMKRIAQIAGATGVKLHDRTRGVKYRVLEIGRASRSRSEQGQEKLRECYKKLLATTSRVVGQSKLVLDNLLFLRHLTSPVRLTKLG